MAVISGASIGPFFGGVLADVIVVRATFVVAGAMLFLGGSVVLFFVTENFKRPEPKQETVSGAQTSTWTILLGSSMVAMLLVLLISRTGQSAIQPLAPLFVGQLTIDGSPAALSGVAFGVMGITSAISSVFLGRLADRIGQRSILILSMSLAGAFYFPQAAAQTPVQYILAMGLFGIAIGGIMPTAASIVANLTPAERRGVIYGFTNTAMSVGAFIGPIGGTVLAAWIDIRSAFVFLGILTVLTAIWTWFALPRSIDRPRHVPSTPTS
jgi:MFS transporter, DHA1 family, multidrug resistance protein